jgi:hypothetical protein
VRCSSTVAIALCLFLAQATALADDDSAGCTVLVASVDAHDVATFRAECHWRVAPAFVTAVVSDPVRLAESSSALLSSEKLPDGRLVNLQDTPWPAADRQSTLTVEQQGLPGGGLHRTFRLADVQAPVPANAVQVAVDDGSWEITTEPGGGTHLVLVMRYEPGGNLPPRFVHEMSPRHIARGLDELRVSAEALASAGAHGTPDVASAPGRN